MSTNRTFEIGGRLYKWSGGFGAILKSYERGVRVGDVRVIGDELLYAYLVYPRWFGRAEVCWTQPKPSVEGIHDLQRKFFGV